MTANSVPPPCNVTAFHTVIASRGPYISQLRALPAATAVIREPLEDVNSVMRWLGHRAALAGVQFVTTYEPTPSVFRQVHLAIGILCPRYDSDLHEGLDTQSRAAHCQPTAVPMGTQRAGSARHMCGEQQHDGGGQ